MRRDLVICAVAAATLHAILLFGIRVGSEAVALPLGETNNAVEVNLVAAPAPAEEAPAPPDPAPAEPEPTPPPPEPDPTPPPPEPTPAPEMAPSPEPSPALPKSESKPAPSHPVVHPQSTKVHGHPSTSQSETPGQPGATGPAAPHGAVTSARYRSNPQPEYPPEARKLQQQGVVYLNVQVTAEGRPESVSVARSSGFPLLDSAAVAGVRRWSFEPGRAAGLPISSSVQVPVRFRLN